MKKDYPPSIRERKGNLPAISYDARNRIETRIYQAYLELYIIHEDRDELAKKIAHKVGCPVDMVETVIDKRMAFAAAKKAKEKFLDEVIGQKIPVLKHIVGLSLHTVKSFLVDIASDPERIKLLTVAEIKQLASISTELNQMLRLELGEPTQNISIDNQHMVPIININIENEKPVVVSSQ